MAELAWLLEDAPQAADWDCREPTLRDPPDGLVSRET